MDEMRCIGTYYSDYGIALLYQASFMKDRWITNICFQNPMTGALYSPTMTNIVLHGRDHDGCRRDSTFWSSYVNLAHDSFVLMQ